MATSKFDMKNWKTGPVTLFQAFGFSKGTVSYPSLSTGTLPAQVGAAITGKGARVKPAKGKGGNAPLPAGGDPAKNAALGKKMAARFGWTGEQWTALNNIAMAESGWSTTAENGSSGAYGIPQALPGSKMASAGKNWKTSAGVQIFWMLHYIRARYGTPAKAWQFHLANGWY